jgi:glycopeptide antibiotics resistance protein
MIIELRVISTLLAGILIAAIALVASGVVIAVSRQRGADRDFIVDRLVMVWLMAALAAVAILTLQPGPGGFDAARPAKLSPFSPLNRRDALANLLLYLPVGFFAVSLWRSKSRPVVWATGFALSVSLTIEFAQWVLPIDRASTTHDVLFNTAGGFIGAVAGAVVARLARKSV